MFNVFKNILSSGEDTMDLILWIFLSFCFWASIDVLIDKYLSILCRRFMYIFVKVFFKRKNNS